MKCVFKRTLCSILLSGVAIPAFAQEDPCSKKLPKAGDPLCVSITAYRLDKPPVVAGTSVSVVTQEDMQRRGDRTAADALKRIPGVTLSRNGGIGSTSQVRVRGSDPGQVRVLVDGISVNDASNSDNSFDFATMLVTDIERVEVLRGPQSSLYGADAIGGVINIITRKGPKNNGISAFSEAGTYRSFTEGFDARGGDQVLYYGMSAQHLKTEGFNRIRAGREKDGTRVADLKANLGGKFADNWSFDLSGGYSDAKIDFDPSPTVDGNAIQYRAVAFGQATTKLTLLDGRLDNTVKFGANDTSREFDEPQSTTRFSTFDGLRTQASYQADLRVRTRDVASAGVEFQRDDSRTTSTTAANVTTTGVNRAIDNHAVFGQYIWGATEDWTITVSGRHDNNQQFDSANTYRLTSAYEIRPTRTTLHASTGTGYKAPSLFQLFSPANGNASLEPEESRGYDAGVTQRFWGERASLDVTGFHNAFENLIVFDTLTSRYFNVRKANTYGLEHTLNVAIMPELLVTAAYTWLMSEDESNNRRLQRRPRHTATLGVDYDISVKSRVGAQWRYISRQWDTSSGDRVVKPYTAVDVTASYDLTNLVSVYGRVENLLDKSYQEAARYSAPGRSVFGGLRARY